jgi:hypothetical protein
MRHPANAGNRCLASAFGNCITSGNDPVCEARKLACQTTGGGPGSPAGPGGPFGPGGPGSPFGPPTGPGSPFGPGGPGPPQPSVGRLNVLLTGYSQLPQLGKEEAGYGLYSYAVLTSDSDKSSAFLGEVFKSIPAIEDTAAQRIQLNIFYIPIKEAKSGEFTDSVNSLGKDPEKLGIMIIRIIL